MPSHGIKSYIHGNRYKICQVLTKNFQVKLKEMENHLNPKRIGGIMELKHQEKYEKNPQASSSLFDSKEIEETHHRKNLTGILLETRASSVTQNIAEKFLVPFALVLQASSLAISILSTLPQLLGALTQLFSVKILHTFSSRKKLIAACMFLQSIIWLPLFLIPSLFPRLGVASLIVAYCLFYMFGGFFIPAWTSWIVALVPEDLRGRFFGRKHQLAGRYGFIAAAIAGYILSVISEANIWLAYAVIFAAASLAKFISVLYVLRLHEDQTTQRIPSFEHGTLKDFFVHIRETSFGKYVLYMCCMSFAVWIASPFFTPYMLTSQEEGGLGMTYLQFTIVNTIATFVSFSVFRHWGKLTDRFGNKRVLVFTALFTPFVPVLWLFSKNFWFIVVIEIFSGIIWAGFNLASANYVFDFVGDKRRMLYSAYYNSFTTSAAFLGAIVGSVLYKLGIYLDYHGIFFIFVLSALLRLIVALFFLPKLREMREVEGYQFVYELSVRPVQGFIHGAVQSIRDSYHHFKQEHIVDIIKIEQYFKGKAEKTRQVKRAKGK